MKRGKVIAIEGVSNTGKTTTCDILKKYEDYIIIPEVADWMSSPPKSSKSYEEEVKNQKIFFKIEKKRMEYARRLADNGKNVIVDRTALSTLAISYANEKMRKIYYFWSRS